MDWGEGVNLTKERMKEARGNGFGVMGESDYRGNWIREGGDERVRAVFDK